VSALVQPPFAYGTTLQPMRIHRDRPDQPVIHVDCPNCHWVKALFAYSNASRHIFFCPRCQHFWDILPGGNTPATPGPATRH